MRPRHRRHGPPWHHRRGPWALIHGLHRRVVMFLASAMVLGAVVGVGLHALEGTPRLGVLFAAFLVFWPLSWAAAFRIARPVAKLAGVARHLREGELLRRQDIEPAGEVAEVAEVASALREMADRVAAQLDDQRALLAAVSHELRSPLSRLRILAELAREERAPADLHDRIQAEIDGMDALVGDLLAGSRIDFEAIQPVDLRAGDVARRALEAARVPDDVLALDWDGTLRADATLLTRAVSGLLVNAVRHAGGPATLRVFEIDDHVRFEVTDDGPGFGPGEEEHVFEPFWRAPPGAGRKPQGTGLGLALVRRIAEAHGGAAGASNRAEGGARVWLALPLRRDD
ncbi:MAG: HAMP domain-containing histidine kinase [Myxococcales bacterium]|nr:HAMP domain-containing histidine kinase [Myxococcales bacterium]